MSAHGNQALRRCLSFLLALNFALPVFAFTGFASRAEHIHIPAGEPVWDWSEDCASCSAVFTCADCGGTFTREADVAKNWKGEGPDKNGGGIYYFVASVSVNGTAYTDRTEPITTEGYRSPDPCPLDGIDHGDSAFGKLIRFFHMIFYYLAHMFEINRYGD